MKVQPASGHPISSASRRPWPHGGVAPVVMPVGKDGACLQHGPIRAVVRMRVRARARRADPRSLAGAARAETRARASKLPWPKKPARANLLTLRPGDKPRPPAGFRTGHSRAARKGPPRPVAASPTSPHHMIAARRRCPGSHIAIAPELPPRVLAAPLRVAQLVSARPRHDAVGCTRHAASNVAFLADRMRGGVCGHVLCGPPAVPTEVRPGGTARVRLVNDRGLGRCHRREGPWMRRRGDLHVGRDSSGPV
jgi:hypothetical protein